MDRKIYSVTELNKYIKLAFDEDAFFKNISIRGEITNFKQHYTGHLYFTIKDENSTLKCVMFRSYAEKVKFKLSDGMKVVINGNISVYEASGSYQMYVQDIQPEGLGSLYLAYEQLKKRLDQEGLFDNSKKKKIPFLPKRVGVITSRTGAVIRDIINVTNRRYNKQNLLIYPAQVQGVYAVKTIIDGLNYFNQLNNVDVIIIARGGGSFEDLFVFNDENLARTIYNSKIPVISAVGHETDFTICDFVSDLRAPTPSAAAELIYPEINKLYESIDLLKYRCKNASINYIIRNKEYIERIKASKLQKVPMDIIIANRIKIDSVFKSMENNIRFKFTNSRNSLNKYITKLDALSPLKTLTRGYSVCKMGNHIVSSIKDVKINDEFEIILKDGSFKGNVISKGEENE